MGVYIGIPLFRETAMLVGEGEAALRTFRAAHRQRGMTASQDRKKVGEGSVFRGPRGFRV